MDIDEMSMAETGFDTVRAVSASLLGWQTDGDAVVVLTMTRSRPAGPHVGAPQVLALHPGGGQTSLITVTADANRIDVARNLLDHFGGESRSRWDLLVDTFLIRLRQARAPIAAIAVLVAAGLIYRCVRGFWPWLPRRFRNQRHPHR